MPDLSRPARRRLLLAVVAIGVAIGVAAVVAGARHSPDPVARRPPGPVASAGPVTRPATRPRPVVLVTGYSGDTVALTRLRDALRGAGRDAEVATPLGNATGDIVDQARHLADVVGATLRRTGAASVDVVGMSAGGVVVRYWVAELGGDALTRRVVTLASPNHGVDLSGFRTPCREACHQLAQGSGFLRDLNRDETPPGPSWVATWSTGDSIVPPASSPLRGALSFPLQAVCPGLVVDHAQVPTDPVVQRIVGALLGAGPPAVPPAAVCS